MPCLQPALLFQSEAQDREADARRYAVEATADRRRWARQRRHYRRLVWRLVCQRPGVLAPGKKRS